MTKYGNVVIIDFKRDYSVNIKDGYAFTMSLKQIKVAKVAKTAVVKAPVKKQTKAVTKKGRQQPKKTAISTAKTNKTKYTMPPKKYVQGGRDITEERA